MRFLPFPSVSTVTDGEGGGICGSSLGSVGESSGLSSGLGVGVGRVCSGCCMVGLGGVAVKEFGISGIENEGEGSSW